MNLALLVRMRLCSTHIAITGQHNQSYLCQSYYYTHTRNLHINNPLALSTVQSTLTASQNTNRIRVPIVPNFALIKGVHSY